MDAKQAKQIRAVINLNCETRHVYHDDNGHCILGGMAVAANIPLPMLFDNGLPIGHRTLYLFADLLCAEYGCNLSGLMALQCANDEYALLDDRRAALRRVVRSLARRAKK